MLIENIERPLIGLDIGTEKNFCIPMVLLDEIKDIAVKKYIPGGGKGEFRHQRFDSKNTFQKFYPSLKWFFGTEFDLFGYNLIGFDLNHIAVKTGENLLKQGVRIVDVMCLDMFLRSNGKQARPRSQEEVYEEYTGETFKAHSTPDDVIAVDRLLNSMLEAHPKLPRTVEGLHKISTGMFASFENKKKKKEEEVFESSEDLEINSPEEISPVRIPKGIKKKIISNQSFEGKGEDMEIKGSSRRYALKDMNLPNSRISHVTHSDPSVGGAWLERLIWDVRNGVDTGAVKKPGLENFKEIMAFHINKVKKTKRRGLFQAALREVATGREDMVYKKLEVLRPIMRAFGMDVKGDDIVLWNASQG